MLFIFLSSSANGINKNELKRFKSTPTLIIFPKSITGLISLKIKEAKPTIVVNAVKRHGMKISDKDLLVEMFLSTSVCTLASI